MITSASYEMFVFQALKVWVMSMAKVIKPFEGLMGAEMAQV